MRKKVNIINIISAKRAKAELKQKLKGVRDDGFGDYDAIVYGINSVSKFIELKSLNDISKYDRFGIGNMDNDK